MVATCNKIDLSSFIRPLLQERSWGISLEASTFAIQENADSFESIKKYLEDKNPEVSLQAAFILAHYTQDEEALLVFEKRFKEVSRPLKEQILVGIGQIGAKQSIPFLVELLDEPFESIRISAARALLLCLNH
ncbi:unnamed protein product [marine sediment metagenome]|uniref:HEAT repeat domain-containing protein n=1 Tax=marine sediment metagenome TaxID=412755 RepID=X1U7E2_9ZZZZ